MAKRGIQPNSANHEERILSQEEGKQQEQIQTLPPYYALRKAQMIG